VFWAELHITSGLAAVLNATVPLFGLPLAHRALAAEPMTPHKTGGVVLGVLGLAIVFSAELAGDSPLAAWASAGVLVASLAGAQAGVLVKAKATHLDPAVLAGVQMAAGSVPLLAAGAALEGNPFQFHWIGGRLPGGERGMEHGLGRRGNSGRSGDGGVERGPLTRRGPWRPWSPCSFQVTLVAQAADSCALAARRVSTCRLSQSIWSLIVCRVALVASHSSARRRSSSENTGDSASR
jgi:hypothetical protein